MARAKIYMGDVWRVLRGYRTGISLDQIHKELSATEYKTYDWVREQAIIIRALVTLSHQGYATRLGRGMWAPAGVFD